LCADMASPCDRCAGYRDSLLFHHLILRLPRLIRCLGGGECHLPPSRHTRVAGAHRHVLLFANAASVSIASPHEVLGYSAAVCKSPCLQIQPSRPIHPPWAREASLLTSRGSSAAYRHGVNTSRIDRKPSSSSYSFTTYHHLHFAETCTEGNENRMLYLTDRISTPPDYPFVVQNPRSLHP
jgi:hypothetical protein